MTIIPKKYDIHTSFFFCCELLHVGVEEWIQMLVNMSLKRLWSVALTPLHCLVGSLH